MFKTVRETLLALCLILAITLGIVTIQVTYLKATILAVQN
jgi:hypothetical protein